MEKVRQSVCLVSDQESNHNPGLTLKTSCISLLFRICWFCIRTCKSQRNYGKHFKQSWFLHSAQREQISGPAWKAIKFYKVPLVPSWNWGKPLGTPLVVGIPGACYVIWWSARLFICGVRLQNWKTNIGLQHTALNYNNVDTIADLLYLYKSGNYTETA